MKLNNFIIVILLTIALQGCNWDTIEKHYPNYKTATNENFQGNGYLPSEHFKKSIKEIYLISNLDSHEYLIKFSFSDSIDWKEFINDLNNCEFIYSEPETIRIPDWWDFQQDKVKQFCYQDKYKSDFIFAIDLKKGMVYSWDNYGRK